MKKLKVILVKENNDDLLLKELADFLADKYLNEIEKGKEHKEDDHANQSN